MKREEISKGDIIKVKGKIFEVVRIGREGFVDKKGNVKESEEFRLKSIDQKGFIPGPTITWLIKDNRILFSDLQELNEEDIEKQK